jgi:Fur family peroxide stress response transcriptional regulator
VPDPEVRLQELVDKIRQRGGRLTPQRVAVLGVLAESKGHPSVEQIYDQIKVDFPTTSLATIYKTVNLLKEMGEVLELGFADDSNRYDGNRPYPHPHLICTRCGEIHDLEVPSLSEIVQQVSQEVGYQIVSHRCDFYGICPKCRGSDSQAELV